MHDVVDTKKKHTQNRSRLYDERYHNIKTCQSRQYKLYIIFFISSCIIVYFYPIIIIGTKYDCE
jgi:hypothetical protein